MFCVPVGLEAKMIYPEKKQSSIADTYFGEYQFQKAIETENMVCLKM
jgi:hypothetical protein